MDEWEVNERNELLDRFYVFYNFGLWFCLGYSDSILDIFFRNETPLSSILLLFLLILLPFLSFAIYETFLYLKKGDELTYQEKKHVKYLWLWLLLGVAKVVGDCYRIFG